MNIIKPEFLPTYTKLNKLWAIWLNYAYYYVKFPSSLCIIFNPIFKDLYFPFTLLGPK